MLNALRRLFVRLLFGSTDGIPAAPPLPLDRRVAALEAEQLRMLDEWDRTRQQIVRWMKRVAHMKPEPLPDPEIETEEEEDDDIDRLILRRKINGV